MQHKQVIEEDMQTITKLAVVMSGFMLFTICLGLGVYFSFS